MLFCIDIVYPDYLNCSTSCWKDDARRRVAPSAHVVTSTVTHSRLPSCRNCLYCFASYNTLSKNLLALRITPIMKPFSSMLYVSSGSTSLAFKHLSMQKIKVLLAFLTPISLVTHRLHEDEPSSDESVGVTMEEAGHPAIGWLPCTQKSRKINDHLSYGHQASLLRSSGVLYNLCLIAWV